MPQNRARGKDYFRDELNTPGMLRLIGKVKGLEVLDIACGEGYNTRILARKGTKATGIDLSGEMVENAKSQEKKDRLGIRYYVSDSADLSRFRAKRFDLVTCFMALMDIEDFQGTIREIARVMKNDGRFIFSITHPCFEFSAKSREIERTARYFRIRSNAFHGEWSACSDLSKPQASTEPSQTTPTRCTNTAPHKKTSRTETYKKRTSKISTTETGPSQTALNSL